MSYNNLIVIFLFGFTVFLIISLFRRVFGLQCTSENCKCSCKCGICECCERKKERKALERKSEASKIDIETAKCSFYKNDYIECIKKIELKIKNAKEFFDKDKDIKAFAKELITVNLTIKEQINEVELDIKNENDRKIFNMLTKAHSKSVEFFAHFDEVFIKEDNKIIKNEEKVKEVGILIEKISVSLVNIVNHIDNYYEIEQSLIIITSCKEQFEKITN